MAMPILSVPEFPNVPNVMGVPALIRRAAPVLDAIGYISNISNKINLLFNTPVEETWGVFDENGDNALTPDSFLGLDYKKGTRLLDYPLEKGAFESYNKVQAPFEASITMSKGGTTAERQAFLYSVEKLVEGLDLYTITTPEFSYVSVNLERYDYRREVRNGSHLLIVNLYFREIRVTAGVNVEGEDAPPTEAADVAEPAAVDAESIGQITPSVLTTIQDTAMSGAASVMESVKSVTSSIGEAVGSAKAAVSGAYSSVVGGISGTASTAINAFSPQILATPSVVTSVLSSVGSAQTIADSVTPGLAKVALRGIVV